VHPLKSSSAIVLLALAAAGPAPRGDGGVEGRIRTEVKITTKGATSQRDVVVWLEAKVKPAEPPAPGKASVVQKKLNFEPHVLPIVRGSTVEFANEDQVKHNVFLEAECCKLDADTEKGETKAHTFGTAGEFPIICRLHPEMAMHVLVLDTPHFVRVELQKDKDLSTDGKNVFTAAFRLDGVPPGTYVLRTWNKKLKALERELVVADGKTEAVELTLEK
jgi:plastocyanin